MNNFSWWDHNIGTTLEGCLNTIILLCKPLNTLMVCLEFKVRATVGSLKTIM